MITLALPAALTSLAVLTPAGPLPMDPNPPDTPSWPFSRWVTVNSLPRIVYTAHRGGALEVPENSMSGLTAAFQRGTAQVLDVDVRMLGDGTLVAMHDATLDRTTNMTGPVRELTREDWKRVRITPDPDLKGDWKPERPPTLAEVLDKFGGKIVLVLEAKDPDSLSRLATQLYTRGLSRSVFVNSNKPEVARKAHEMGLVAQLWRSANQMRTDEPEEWSGFVDVFDVDYRASDKDLRRAVASGIPRVWAHTVNTPEQRDRVLRLGCDGVITDAPGLLARTPARGAVPVRPLGEG